MKKFFVFFLAMAVCVMLQAQKTSTGSSRLKVGVVFGGGGAKGAAHIGVLKYLEEMGVPVDYVAGTSMGSIIGGFYAMGYTPDELTRLIASMNWSEYIGNKIDRSMMSKETRNRSNTMFLNIPFSMESLFDNNSKSSFISQLPSAYVSNSSLINLFNDLCVGYQEDMDFNDLPIPFACVATDLITGKEVVLRYGSVPTAMRASMAIPGVFSPVSYGDKMLVDGGLVNNFPADVLREMGADIVIGVEVASTKEVTADDLRSLPQVFARLLTNSTSAKKVENRALCDVHIIPDISGFGMLSFTADAIDTLVSRGYNSAAAFHDKLLEIKQAVDASAGYNVRKELHAPHAKDMTSESVLIGSISFDNVSEKDSRWLVRKGRLKPGNHYSKDDIDKAINIYRGTGCFDEITYQVREIDSIHGDDQLSEAYNLKISMKPAKPHVFGLGVRYDTEDGTALLLNVGLNEKKFNGPKLSLNIKLSYSPRINLTYTYSKSSLAKFNLAYDFRKEYFRILTSNYSGIYLQYKQHKVSGYISQFHLLNVNTALGVSYSHTAFDKTSIVEETVMDSVFFATNRLLTPYVTVQYDNLNDTYFATSGIFARLSALYHFDLMHKVDNKFFELNYAFQAYITPYKGKITIIPQVYGRYVPEVDYVNLWTLMGGEVEGRHFDHQLPFIGVTTTESTYNNTAILRCDFRYNFYKKHYLTAMYNFAVPIALIGEGGMSQYSSHGAGLKYSYNSLLGPISLTAHWTNYTGESRFGAYFSFGYIF